MQAERKNLYLPYTAEISEIIEENSQIKTFVLAFVDQELQQEFSYEPGQFMMLSVPHCGEAPISISSSPAQPDSLHLSIRAAGKLTGAMHELTPGDTVGLRGPYGRPFPMADLVGHDLMFVAGGIGLAPLRSVISTCLAEARFANNRLTILYGSRTPSDIAFQADLDSWQNNPQVDCHLTVDLAEPGWDDEVGVVTSLLDRVTLDPARSKALICGPGLMIKAVIGELKSRNYHNKNIITTLERHMKCGVGLCRHCHMDQTLVCKDGPVFTWAELLKLKGTEFDP
ncbi:MAG: FAD/NAD(P)-binding protein [Thermodesulfobacteriota bacterium]